jgi:hypothetical protein
MTLDAYLTDKNMSDAEFGGLIRRNQSTVYRLRRNLTRPDWATLSNIVKATGGEVTAADFELPAPDAKVAEAQVRA